MAWWPLAFRWFSTECATCFTRAQDSHGQGHRLLRRRQEAPRPRTHDFFSQKLAVLGIEVTAPAQRTHESSESPGGHLRHIEEQIGGSANDIHGMSRRLHPAIVDDLGLPAALESGFLRAVRHSRRIHSPGRPGFNLSEEISRCLYRVAQESLRNIVKQARAREVRVALTTGDGNITLVIEDRLRQTVHRPECCGFDSFRRPSARGSIFEKGIFR